MTALLALPFFSPAFMRPAILLRAGSLWTFSCCLLLGVDASAAWDSVAQERSVFASAAVYAATRCDGGESQSDIAPGFAPFAANVSANWISCSTVRYAGAAADQISSIDADSIRASGGASTNADQFGYATARSKLHVRFRIDSPQSFVLQGTVKALHAGDGGGASAHIILTHPDGSVESVRAMAQGTASTMRVERPFRTHGGGVSGEYAIDGQCSATNAYFLSSASFSLHVETRPAVAVEAISWERLKALYR